MRCNRARVLGCVLYVLPTPFCLKSILFFSLALLQRFVNEGRCLFCILKLPTALFYFCLQLFTFPLPFVFFTEHDGKKKSITSLSAASIIGHGGKREAAPFHIGLVAVAVIFKGKRTSLADERLALPVLFIYHSHW